MCEDAATVLVTLTKPACGREGLIEGARHETIAVDGTRRDCLLTLS